MTTSMLHTQISKVTNKILVVSDLVKKIDYEDKT